MPRLIKPSLAMLVGMAVVAPPALPVLAAETYVVPSMSRPAVRPYPGTQRSLEGVPTETSRPLTETGSRGSDGALRETPRSLTAPAPWGEGDATLSPADEASVSLLVETTPDPSLSAMERFFAAAPGLSDVTLRQFGYDTFKGELAGGNVVSDASVPGYYPLGPGDELILNAPLSTEELRAVVDRSGKIFLPGRGLISVSGMTLEQFQTMMRGGKGAQVSVRLGKLRSQTVYLSGRVARPGSYTVNALSTVTTLLQMAGGVSKNGSLRQIQVRRGGKTVATFDLYDFLLKGTNAGNLRLEAGDVVFVPNIGPQVAVAGSVRQPAIYEIKAGTTAAEVVSLTGGMLPQAYTEKVQLQRVAPNSGREIRTLDFTQAAAQGTSVKDGDLITIAGVLDRVENGVTLKGNVERPGLYEITAGTRVSEVIGAHTELKTESYFDYAQIEREVGEDRHIEIIPFNLGKALAKDPSADPILKARDTITIFSLKEFQKIPEVEIHGAVLKPGKYRLFPNMRIAELISRAGGMLPEADRQSAELTRTQIIDRYVKRNRLEVSPTGALMGNDNDNVTLAKDDVVLIHKVPNYHKTWTVEVGGEVMRPGTYSILEGETLSQLLDRAGGFTPRAYPAGASFTRESVKTLQQIQMRTLADRIEQSLTSLQFKETDNSKLTASMAAQQELVKRLRNTEATGRIVVDLDTPNRMRKEGKDLSLSNGDKLYVPSHNDTISVLGAVYSPNALRHAQGMTVGEYLGAAGGATSVGDMKNLYVIRADGRVHALSNYSESWWIFRRNLLSSALNPGDTIIVPERVEWVDHWGEFLRNSSAIAQILTSGALLYNTFK
ncbi:Polysialic acid transport protein KpsD precursor [compost metagenome]